MLRPFFVLLRTSIVQLESSVSSGHFLSLSCDCFPGTDIPVPRDQYIYRFPGLCSTCSEIKVSANMSTFDCPKNPDWSCSLLHRDNSCQKHLKCMDLFFFWDLLGWSQTCTLKPALSWGCTQTVYILELLWTYHFTRQGCTSFIDVLFCKITSIFPPHPLLFSLFSRQFQMSSFGITSWHVSVISAIKADKKIIAFLLCKQWQNQNLKIWEM